jgi:predicted MFS family arabinose efflux permease
VLVAGALVTGVLASVTALAPSFAWLLLGLLVAGLGFPSGHTAGNKLVIRRFAPHARGMAIGIRMSGLPAGGALSALIIPFLAGIGGWRLALVAIGLLCAVFGALCAALPRDGETTALVRPPAAPVRALASDRGYVRMTLMGAMLVVGQFTLQGFLAVYLVDAHGWSAPSASRLLALVHLGGVIGRLTWGAASDRLAAARRKPVLALVMTGGLLLLLGLGVLPGGAGVGMAAAVAFAGGLFMAGWNGLFMNLLTEHVGADRAATAIGASLTVMYVATMASYPVFGSVVQAAHSYTAAWLLVAACQGIALFLLTRVREG